MSYPRHKTINWVIFSSCNPGHLYFTFSAPVEKKIKQNWTIIFGFTLIYICPLAFYAVARHFATLSMLCLSRLCMYPHKTSCWHKHKIDPFAVPLCLRFVSDPFWLVINAVMLLLMVMHMLMLVSLVKTRLYLTSDITIIIIIIRGVMSLMS